MTVSRPKVKQTRKVMATVYLVKVVMRWKILRAPMMALTIALSPGLVSTMSAAPLAASVAPAEFDWGCWVQSVVVGCWGEVRRVFGGSGSKEWMCSWQLWGSLTASAGRAERSSTLS